jgi:serralysin
MQFENIKGGRGHDTLAGNSASNQLLGNSGDDRIFGGNGSDILIGGTGNDTYIFSATPTAEVDTLIEGVNGGIDTLDFTVLTTDVVMKLGTAILQQVHLNRRIKLNNGLQFENLKGGSGNDVLSGNSANNLLLGNAGDDRLSGGSGDDILSGGAGNDELYGGAHQDILIAGTMRYESNSAALMKLVQQWTADLELAQKINTFRQPSTSVNVSLLPEITVFDDGLSTNRLAGEDGIDWVFSSIGDLLYDHEDGEYLN